MKATLTKRTLCGCGWSMIEDHVPLGKVYFVDFYDEHPGFMECGNCRTEHKVVLVKTLMPDDKTWDNQWMPKEFLTIENEKATNQKPGPKLRRRAPVRKRAAVAADKSNHKARRKVKGRAVPGLR